MPKKTHSLPKRKGRAAPAEPGFVTVIMLAAKEMFIEHQSSCNPAIRSRVDVACMVNYRGELVLVPRCEDCGICTFIDPGVDRGGVPVSLGSLGIDSVHGSN